MYNIQATATNQTYTIQRIFKQKIRIEAISALLSSGSCNIQINVDGVNYGDVIAVTSAGNESVLGTPIEVVDITTSHAIGYTVTGASSAANLEITYSVGVLST
jgi:protein-disulfide isomerase